MKSDSVELILILVTGVVLGIFLVKYIFKNSLEGFNATVATVPKNCPACLSETPCKCNIKTTCAPACREPDLSKYVLKTTVPPPIVCPNLSNYVLKSEIPPVPDMSKYVLKSSIPRQQPVILDCSKCNKPKGECPPCPRARCPEIKCPPATICPPKGTCPPCPVSQAPKIKCMAEDLPTEHAVRPYLAPLSVRGFGAF
jgi:hypothetical protein